MSILVVPRFIRHDMTTHTSYRMLPYSAAPYLRPVLLRDALDTWASAVGRL